MVDIGADIGLLDNKLAGLVANLVVRVDLVGRAVVDNMNMDNIHSASLGNTDSDIAVLDMVLVVLVLVLVLNWLAQNRLLKLIQVLVVVVV